MKDDKVFDNKHMRFEDCDGILFVWYKEGTFTLEIAKSMVSNRKKFTNNQPVKVLVKQAGLKGIKGEARTYLSSEEAVEGIISAAILARNAFERHLANFFISITVIRPKVPTKVFTDEEEALNWLREEV
jgi:acetate kinase